LITVFFISCGQQTIFHENSTPEEKWEIVQDNFMAPNASASSERPLQNVLSEREVLLKVADIAVAEGILDPSHYAYEINPALKDAKIATPILVTDANSGVPDMYILQAVDSQGIRLASVSVSSDPNNVNDESFVYTRSIPTPDGPMLHIMTKLEAAELIQSQFPDSTTSGPIAVNNLRLGEDPYSDKALLWYFTVSENTRSAVDSGSDYVIDAYITNYTSIPGGITNRAAINMDYTSFHLDGYRMVKLDRPINLFSKIDEARSVGGVSFASSIYPSNSIGFTPVQLK
jgi:hypothetical protein